MGCGASTAPPSDSQKYASEDENGALTKARLERNELLYNIIHRNSTAKATIRAWLQKVEKPLDGDDASSSILGDLSPRESFNTVVLQQLEQELEDYISENGLCSCDDANSTPDPNDWRD